MCERKEFPNYDDAAHIDSAAVATPEKKREGDPGATEYTETYYQPYKKQS